MRISDWSSDVCSSDLREMKAGQMLERREVWPGQIPAGAALLTAGVDTQPDRLAVEFVAWGRGEESWSVLHTEIEGDPDEEDVWLRLDELLQRPLYRADGRPFVVRSEEHTSELQSLMRISYAVFCLKK